MQEFGLWIWLVAYLFLGGEIIRRAITNLLHGEVFDENLLMTVATLGAFAINAYEEAVGVMLFYRIGEYCEDLAVEKSRREIMRAVDMRPHTVNIIKAGTITTVPALAARVGDILEVRVGERIPLDGVVVEGESFVDTSPITGEPVPVRRARGEQVVSGCINTAAVLQIRVEKLLEESMVSRILASVEKAAEAKPHMDKFITRFASVYTPAVLAAAVLLAVIGGVVTGLWHKWLYTALTFLVVSCPCALVLSVPLAFFAGIGAGGRQGILFKGGIVLEALRECKAVAFDKTGTLTRGEFVVQKVLLLGSYDRQALLTRCASAELNSVHPVACSIVQAARSEKIRLNACKDISEYAGEGLCAQLDGERVLCGNKKLMERFGVRLVDYVSRPGATEVLVAVNEEMAGVIYIADTLRENTAEALAQLHAMGLKTALLTGDSTDNAAAAAQALGIGEYRAQLLPQDKLQAINELRAKYGRVLFVGDGINDAPVLAGADVGAAMGAGADAAIEVADLVIMKSDPAALPQAIELAHSTAKIAWQNVALALAVKLAVMGLGLAGIVSLWLAVLADTGVALLCLLNSMRKLY